MERRKGHTLVSLTILVSLAIADYHNYGEGVYKGSEFILKSDVMVEQLGMVNMFDWEDNENDSDSERIAISNGFRDLIILMVMWYWV